MNQKVISDEDLKRLLHPTEFSRFILAILVSIPILALLVYLVIESSGTLLFGLIGLFVSVWFVLRLLEAVSVGNSVRVGPQNFPDVYEILVEVKAKLRYRKNVEIFILKGGSFEAILFRFFRTKFIMLNSDVVEGLTSPNFRPQLVWIIARHIGALKARRLRIDLFSLVVENVEHIKIFNLFLLPYFRATQLSGDQIGMAVCGSLDSSIKAFDKILVGKNIADRVRMEGLLIQADEVHRSLFARVAKLISPFPHLTDRYLNLLAFARFRYPVQFNQYLAQYDDLTRAEINALLPNFYPSKSEPISNTVVPYDFQRGPNKKPARFVALVGIDGPMRDCRVSLTSDSITIGANSNNDVVIKSDQYVSGRHASIVRKRNQLFVNDLRSRNGTFLNGQKVEGGERSVKLGDKLTIGSSIFKIA